jgi:hypothetical protein
MLSPWMVPGLSMKIAAEPPIVTPEMIAATGPYS